MEINSRGAVIDIKYHVLRRVQYSQEVKKFNANIIKTVIDLF